MFLYCENLYKFNLYDLYHENRYKFNIDGLAEGKTFSLKK